MKQEKNQESSKKKLKTQLEHKNKSYLGMKMDLIIGYLKIKDLIWL
jgi:hypothetical protein